MQHKGRRSKFLFLSEKTSCKYLFYKCTLATASLSLLPRDVHSPIYSYRHKPVKLTERICPHLPLHCMALPHSQPIQLSHDSTLSSALCPATSQAADCHGKHGEFRKLDMDMDSSWHLWKCKKNQHYFSNWHLHLLKTQTSSFIHENLS